MDEENKQTSAAPVETEVNEPKLPMGTKSTREKNAAPAKTDATTTEETQADKDTEETTDTTAQNSEGGDKKKENEGDDKDVDYKKKFSDSSTEAQRMLDLFKSLGIDPKTGKPITKTEPDKPAEGTDKLPVRGEKVEEASIPLTDEEISKAIPGFENLTEPEKAIIRDTKATVKKIAALEKIVAEIHDEKVFNKEFKDLVKKEEWKKLSDLSEEFKEFAYKDENLEVPLATLAAAFLHSKGSGKTKTEKTPPEGIEKGGGGGKEATDHNKRGEGFTAEEAATIRKTDPKRYSKLIREGKLKIKDEE